MFTIKAKTSSMQSPNLTSKSDQTLSRNMTLLAHHELDGLEGLGEGISIQIANDGRRILWLPLNLRLKTLVL
jgi:hypothetical protein